jgi:iron(III) transport system substrate-binding protein
MTKDVNKDRKDDFRQPEPRVFTRRFALQAGLGAGFGAGALSIAGLTAGVVRAQVRATTKVLDFETSADVAKAEQEGEVVFYTHDGERAAAGVMEAFNKDFPKIKTSYFRAQTGALYSKVLAERSAGRFAVDVIQFSEVGTGIDFQKKGGYQQYVSPQAAAYAPEHLSTPAGYFFWAGVSFGGIAYNTDKVQPADAPRGWKDLLNPVWRNAISTKQVTSGMQFVEWYELRKLYGDEFWKSFAKQRPRGFDSRVQLFDRLSRGDDKVCALAEYAGYALYKEKKAPIALVMPDDGLPASPLVAGVADKPPHPEAARLLVDWLMSLRGQSFYQNYPELFYGSVRKDAPPMPGGVRLANFKLLFPTTDLDAHLASRSTFNKEWNSMLGL